MNILVIGPPGTGKGTQTRRMCEHFGWTRIASGELLRAAVAAGTADGLEAQAYLHSGRLVPDAVIERLVLDRMAQPDCRTGVVLDGFPRTVSQAAALDAALAARGHRVNLVLLLEVNSAVLTRRLAGRLTCRSCAATYHPELNPPLEAGACDRCGAGLYVRDDDRPEIVGARHAVYEQEIQPLLAYYAHDARLRREDGLGTVDEVWERVKRAIEHADRLRQPETVHEKEQTDEGTRVGQAAL
jgi:adenylate kinase